jgi:hypothetical protein
LFLDDDHEDGGTAVEDCPPAAPGIYGVACAAGEPVWQQKVLYPNLSLGDPTNPNPTPLNPQVYGSMSSYTIWPGAGPQNPLTWATNQEQDLVGAVQEPAPDSPAVVP